MNESMQKQKIDKLLLNRLVYWPSIILLFLVILSLYCKTFIFVHNDSEIGFFDNDAIYQVEHLATLVDPKHQTYVTEDVDYGIELIYFSYLIKFLLLFLPEVNLNIFCYYFLFLVHLFFNLAICVLILKIFNRYKVNLRIAFIFFILLYSSVLFFSYSIFIKPDPNTVLFFTLLGAYSFAFNNSRLAKYRNYLSVFFLAIGSLVKWWSVFLLPWISFYGKDFRLTTRRFVRESIYFLISGVTVYFILLALVKLNPAILNQKNSSKYLLVFSVVTVLIFYLGLKVSEKISDKTEFLKKSFEFSLLFVCYLFVFGFIFFQSKTFLNSFGYYTAYLGPKHVTQSDTYGLPIILNFKAWIIDSFFSGYFSPFLVCSLILSFVYYKRSDQKLDIFLKLIIGYILLINLFLFLFVTKKNHATQAMLIPLIWLVLFVLFHREKGKSISIYQIWFYIFLFFQILIQFFPNILPYRSTTGSIISYFQNRTNYNIYISDFHQKLNSRLSTDNKPYVCEYGIPMEKTKSFWVNRESLSESALKEIVPADKYLLSVKGELCFNNLQNSRFFNQVAEFEISLPGRSGIDRVSQVVILKRNYFIAN
ncbi:cation-translocating P-type ATPase [Leptospira levettii]|uniref:Glycosyltransferase RgtA/B/C/D-like domain-containing protein n=1 Tax=Leptospira levettii TaxID=2023178 RepID=A0AAW5VDC9_9LEPT|nr:hypothetical protein [Leptospira levettii]MCW7466218.1 hypothetical protein [Leptospira levettii]MCW7512257.1 hypothetical protein [Leptospira levettii]MCW7516265.1 hypothetical protein [Leptospira levettii]